MDRVAWEFECFTVLSPLQPPCRQATRKKSEDGSSQLLYLTSAEPAICVNCKRLQQLLARPAPCLGAAAHDS